MASTDGKIADAYHLARALLTDRGPDDHGVTSEATERRLLRLDSTVRSSLWGALADEAEYHGVAPLLEPMIAVLSKEMPVPDEVRWAFVALASRHRRAAVAREACIDQLLESFATAGVPIILLKGAALAHRIYPSPGLRPMVDIDVLIAPTDSESAVKIVSDLGYSFASRPASRFAPRMHHLPVATMTRSGFRIALEIHLNAMSPNQAVNLTVATLAGKPQTFRRGSGLSALALGHTDMLRHLAHHAFEPARRLRLIHLYDLWRYQAMFRNEIDWRTLETRFPEVITVLRLISFVFAHPADACSAPEPIPTGVGLGMMPLSEIAAGDIGIVDKLAAVFNPPTWWLHGFYGIAPGKSLLTCQTIRHPARVARWLAQRLMSGIIVSSLASDRQPDSDAGRWKTCSTR